MTAALQKFSNWFWSDTFWLPGTLTWEDYDKGTDTERAYPRDLIIVLPLSVFLLLVRVLFEK